MSPWIPRILLGIGLAALAAALISIAVGEGGPGAPAVVGGVNDVQRILGGIHQEDDTLGSPDAEVTVTVFNDMQCEPCAEFETETIDTLVDPYVLSEEVKLVYRHFSLAPNETTLAAIAAEAAGEQARQWQYVDTFVRNLDGIEAEGVTEEFLRQVAEAVPELEVSEWEEDFAAPGSEERVREDAVLAAELELPAEPAVIVDGPGGQRELIETPSKAEIEAAIEAVSA